jgi:sulfatase modifying factor 1
MSRPAYVAPAPPALVSMEAMASGPPELVVKEAAVVESKAGRRSLLLWVGLLGVGIALGIPLLIYRFWGSQADDVRVNPKDGADMVFIPAGPFKMGDVDRSDNPRHTVTLSGYWIYKNVVTVKQYLKFCAATGHAKPSAPSFDPNWSKEDHPIVNVSWDDAKAYCDWAGVRLPTEAEWEKAARGTDGRKYPWGDAWDASKAWCSKSSFGDAGGTTAVGKYGISPYGLSDMAGNVWQWCADWYDADYWKSDHGADPTGPTSGSFRVLRGGSWDNVNPGYFRSASRGRDASGLSLLGFRGAITTINTRP